MSYHDEGQKMVEAMHLDHFLNAYEWVTRERLRVARSHERPDFVCERPDGSHVGLELTRVVRDPQSAWADETFFRKEYMSACDALAGINWAVGIKDVKRQSGSWLYPEATLLVVQAMDCPLREFGHDLLPGDVDPHGFIEVWVADFTGLDAYGDIELFGVYPPQWWGHHERSNAWRKPYG